MEVGLSPVFLELDALQLTIQKPELSAAEGLPQAGHDPVMPVIGQSGAYTANIMSVKRPFTRISKCA
jgi:hypothetical protein